MHIADAQREVRTVFQGGFVGSLVSAALWGTSTALATVRSPRAGIIALTLGGVLIFPVTSALLKLTQGRGALSKENPLDKLAMQVAFTIPFALPVVGGAALYKLSWFYPAMLVIVGAHYLPFVFLYGMRAFYVLGGGMIMAGVMIGLYANESFTLGGWVGTAMFVVFAFVAKAIVGREARTQG
ncbi:MAG TPA: hypothetical protein VEC56_04465 [Candidatus Krumholzibacteria bacterium]|nr:hypothetical protein [Candidatus Krumholzibacteria bacterium]